MTERQLLLNALYMLDHHRDTFQNQKKLDEVIRKTHYRVVDLTLDMNCKRKTASAGTLTVVD